MGMICQTQFRSQPSHQRHLESDLSWLILARLATTLFVPRSQADQGCGLPRSQTPTISGRLGRGRRELSPNRAARTGRHDRFTQGATNPPHYGAWEGPAGMTSYSRSASFAPVIIRQDYSNTFYLGYTMYSPYPGARFFNFLEVCIVQASGHAFQTSASGTLLR